MVAVVGVLWLSWWLLKALKALAGDFCAFFLAPWGISRINLKKYGSWAGTMMHGVVCELINLSPTPPPLSLPEVVTGASEGIGRGYALEVANCGRVLQL